MTGGTFHRTYDGPGADGGVVLAADGGPKSEADPATVSNFRLDKYEVTVGRFRQFVSAPGTPGWTPPAGAGKHTHLNGGKGLANSGSAGTFETGWVTANDTYVAPTDANLACDSEGETWTSTAGSQESLPINCVDMYEAYAFCIWDGGFLPSEAEWAYAAAGGSQQLEYPWGSTAPGTTNQYAIYGCYYPSGSGTCTGAPNIAPVGTPTQGEGACGGQLNMADNVLEWTLDWFTTYVDPCVDCAYLSTESGTIVEAGASSTARRSSSRRTATPTVRPAATSSACVAPGPRRPDARNASPSVTDLTGRPAPSALAEVRVFDRAGNAQLLGASWVDRPCVLVLLRHFGCIGCAVAVADLAPRLREIDAAGTRTVLLGNGSPTSIAGFMERNALDDKPVTLLTDPSLAAFRAAGLQRSAWATFGPRAVVDYAAPSRRASSLARTTATISSREARSSSNLAATSLFTASTEASASTWTPPTSSKLRWRWPRVRAPLQV